MSRSCLVDDVEHRLLDDSARLCTRVHEIIGVHHSDNVAELVLPGLCGEGRSIPANMSSRSA